MPPALLVQGINHLGRYSLSEQDTGLRLANASTYCTLDRMCDPAYGLAASWRILLGLYVLYSCAAMFLDNVLADAMGVRKPPWYFCLPSYWGWGAAAVRDAREVIEPSTDADVLAEEERVQARANALVAGDAAIEVRGLCVCVCVCVCVYIYMYIYIYIYR